MAAGSITEQCALLLPALSAAASGEGEGWRKVEAVDEALVQLRKVAIIFRAGVGCVQLGRTLPTLSPKVVARLHSASKLLVLRREEAPPNPVSPGSTTAVVAGDDPEEEEGEGGPRLPTPRASSLLLTDWSEAASRPGTTSGETASIARTHRRSTAVNESHSFRGAAVVSRSSQPSATCSMSTPSGSRRHRSTISPAINTDSRGHSSHPTAQIGSARPGACTQPEAEERITLPSAAGGVRRRAAMRKSLRLGCVGHYSRRAANMSGEALAWTATAPSFLALGPHESVVRTVTFCCPCRCAGQVSTTAHFFFRPDCATPRALPAPALASTREGGQHRPSHTWVQPCGLRSWCVRSSHGHRSSQGRL